MRPDVQRISLNHKETYATETVGIKSEAKLCGEVSKKPPGWHLGKTNEIIYIYIDIHTNDWIVKSDRC